MEKYINRAIKDDFLKKMTPNKVLLLFGARRVGKTAFIEHFINDNIIEPVLELNGEDMSTSEILKQRTVENYKRLMRNHRVLIIDEAQNLKTSMLEEIRMLSNLETDKEKLFQIILVGQPELKNKLASPNLRQLRQRISVRFHITPLQKDEIAGYINHRLSVAGSSGQIVFGPDAIEKIFIFSGGIPRLINTVCDKSMLTAYVMETKQITMPIVERSIQEMEGLLVG